MITLRKIIILTCIAAGIFAGGSFLYKKYSKKEQKLFRTKKPERRDIKQIIHATGDLEVKGNIKIGSLVSGVVEKIFVDENEFVKKDQQLALIDNGKDDSLVIEARGRLQTAQAERDYFSAFFKRQQSLYESGQLSRDSFEKATRDYHKSLGTVESATGMLKFREIEFGNLHIVAPRDGVIVGVGITLGERVMTDLDATVLFTMGEDITKMEANLEVDESDIGQIKKNQSVKFSVDTFMDRVFRGTISRISYSPTVKKGNKFYKARVDVENDEHLLRPGMTINADIKVAKSKDALAVTHQVFQVDADILKMIAEKITYEFHPILKEKKKRLKHDGSQFQTKYIWIVKDKAFVEKAVKVDITDDIYFEVKSGLDVDDEMVIDIEESDDMEKVYKKWFSGAL